LGRMMTDAFHRYRLLAIVACMIVVADQITKAWVQTALTPFEMVPVIPKVFYLTHVYNTGGAFGFLAGAESVWRQAVFIVTSLVAMGMVLYFYRALTSGQQSMRWAFALIFGGAIGNFIDRVRFGKVVDFLDVFIGSYHWPTFNVADSAISIGIGLFILHMIRGDALED